MSFSRRVRHCSCSLLVLLGLGTGWQPGIPSLLLGQQSRDHNANDTSELKIIIIDGSEGINIVKKKTAVKPVVEVRDKNALPIAGVAILFLLPHSGPSGIFANGKRELTVLTDEHGRATVSGLRPVGKGSFKIAVRATYQGRTATATISQTNFSTVASALKAGKTPGSSSGSAGSSSAAGAGGTSSATATAGTAGAAAGAGGGLSGVAIAGIVGGVAAAGAGAAYAAGAFKGNQTKDCTPTQNQMMSDLNSEVQICGSDISTYSQCLSSAQTVENDAGQLCSCAGGVGKLPSDVQSQLQQFKTLAQQLGLTLPSSCGF